VGALSLALGAFTCSGSPAARPATKTILQPAVEGIFSAFKTHPVVGIGDSHGLPQQAQQMELYAAILRDPRFAREVGNVVVEFGAGGHQNVIDRYVAGETVPYVELRTVWTDTVGWVTTASQVVIARFFAEVRAINRRLPPEHRIRVWLGEPPIDWAAVDSRDDIRPAMRRRDGHPARIVDHILARNEKALVIYGSMHFIERSFILDKWFPILGTSIRRLVERRHPGALFVVLPYNDGLQPAPCAALREQASRRWPRPVLAAPAEGGTPEPDLRHCATIDEADLVARGLLSLSGVKPSKVLGDAVLFLDPAKDAALSPRLPDIFLDADYRREVNRRFELWQGQSLTTFEESIRRATSKSFSLRKADYEIDLDATGYTELLDAMFAQHDLNRDGVVTADEYRDPIQP
jgi:hypothetical protein